MDVKELGLTFGDLRMQTRRIAELSQNMQEEEDLQDLRALDSHVRHMTSIQIAQELNEIKGALVRVADALEKRTIRSP